MNLPVPLHPKVVLSARPVLKRAGAPVADGLPWEELRWESFGPMDEVPLPGPQSFGALEDGDECWGELEKWLLANPDEPEDLPLDGVLLPQGRMVQRSSLGTGPRLGRLGVR